MKNGPVPSRTTDLINLDEEHLTENEYTMAKSVWKIVTDKGTTWDMVEREPIYTPDFFDYDDRTGLIHTRAS